MVDDLPPLLGQVLQSFDAAIAGLISTRNLLAELLKNDEKWNVGTCQHLRKEPVQTMAEEDGWFCKDCGVTSEDGTST